SQLRDFSLDDPRIGMHLMPEDIVAACIQRDIPMIAFTYNEPTIVFEYAYDAFRLAHEHGIRTVFVSSGFETMRVLDEIGPYLDAINVDLKAFTEQFYHEYCSTRFAPVKRNIRHIAQETNTWIEVTTLLIPGLNDSDEELRAMAEFLVEVDTDIPWHLSAFHPNYLMLDRPPTPRETLIRAYDIGRQAGLNFVYVGNVFDEKRESTYCPQCGTLLISRQWYQVRLHWKEPGTCRCGYQIPGIWR
ncbi:MAG TPA: AmmeMemoRadiSam system radical SAM enzyme, partial [Anaerolineae bacterium]|nr:AmmeMemoRadiSam system radical SAM enzyme [Anaerolineae bacterium]